MDFPNVTDVGLNPSAMVGVRYAAVAVITGNWSPALHRTEDSREEGLAKIGRRTSPRVGAGSSMSSP